MSDRYWVRSLSAPLVEAADRGVLANDVDPEGDRLVVESHDERSEAGGSVDVDVDGAFSYAPPSGYWGADGFSYVLADEAGGGALGHVRVWVAPSVESAAALGREAPGFATQGLDPDGLFGIEVAGGGDVDGDGLEDILVGATYADELAGNAYLFQGTGSREPSVFGDVSGPRGFRMRGEQIGDEAGSGVAIVGDVNGDGLADLLIGAPGNGDAGRAYLVFGGRSMVDIDFAALEGSGRGFVISGRDTGGRFGTSVSGAGDLNGDGLADLVVGAPQARDGDGYAAVVFGKVDTAAVSVAQFQVSRTQGFLLEGEPGSAGQAGHAVSGGGDFDGDGWDDIIVGAPNFDIPTETGTAIASGRVYVVWGTPTVGNVHLSDLTTAGGMVLDGERGANAAGSSVSLGGDFDGDGRSDVLIGAPGWSDFSAVPSRQRVGRVYVLLGEARSRLRSGAMSLGAIVAEPELGIVVTGEASGDRLGSEASSAGDVDGDGLQDLVLGVESADPPAGGASAGRVYVVYGSRALDVEVDELTGELGFTVEGWSEGERLGTAVAAGGDFDGDGFGDVLAGAPRFEGIGSVYGVFGGDWRARTVADASPADDVIVGTSAPESLVGGSGDDELRGEGGRDVFRGGAGDDRIVLPDPTLYRIDGGSGRDTLHYTGSVSLDLNNYYVEALHSIEVVDLRGNGPQLLFLDVRHVRRLPDASAGLTLTGDAEDHVVVVLEDASRPFEEQPGEDGAQVFGDGISELRIEGELTAEVCLQGC